ncbi:glycoside hydrolase family 127 protein [Nonomuraea sp. K274]|uniref:Glycoside hydrolase family 127 protein n=1 Tax=Nonomuraea cypriaca TaxID=1187855 RepID=A0A931A406_9ACTN|nr:beta-L-arabinofuranosidase domain-containing protein [Nonomuraea cypriaca]MBF8184605.1 glycoside hydrolase family 127 protein [Nonomuraea cypriaca]
MSDERYFSVVEPRPDAAVALRPVTQGRVRGGFWGARQRVNREVTIPLGGERVGGSGAFDNLRLAGRGAGGGHEHRGKVFADSDVYKWLEALAWERGRAGGDDLARSYEEASELVAAAQCDDGYLHTHTQLTGRARYSDLASSHELYCAGHLMQAAVAGRRATGDDTLLRVAARFADHLVKDLPPDALDGHPEVELGLAELYRETGVRSYLDLAARMVATRGRSLIQLKGHHGPGYRQDAVPVREATTVEGHAVRAMYLAAGATDVAAETPDPELLAALERQWRDMVATKTYLTGGLGSNWYGEAFGGHLELAPDTAYCETCAAIGSVQWSWRMLLATGAAEYADLMERTLHNAVLPGVSLGGDRFFYVNALRVRAGADPDDLRSPARGRQDWYGTACCPPNVMRLLSSLDHYLATQDTDGVQLHLYAPGTIRAGSVLLEVETDYPWSGRIEIVVRETPDRAWTLSARIPAWADTAEVSLAGAALSSGVGAAGSSGAGAAGVGDRPVEPGYHRIRRTWRPGDRVVLDLGIRPRLTAAVPRLDVARGQVAVERGPLVYCLEQADHPGAVIDDLCVAGADLRDGAPITGLPAEVVPVLARGRVHVHGEDDGGFPYRSAAPREPEHAGPADLTFVPYYAWANRGPGAMTVWAPMHEE